MDNTNQFLETDPLLLEVSLEKLREQQLKEAAANANQYIPAKSDRTKSRPQLTVILGGNQPKFQEECRDPGLSPMAEVARQMIDRVDFSQNPTIPKPQNKELDHAA
jgi:hypothetical protein